MLCGVCVCWSHSLSVSRSPEHPWIAVGLQPGSLFQPQGNKNVHLYNWQNGKVHQIFDAGMCTTHTPLSRDLMLDAMTLFPSLTQQVMVVCQSLCTPHSPHVDCESITHTPQHTCTSTNSYVCVCCTLNNLGLRTSDPQTTCCWVS